ncbi:MAG: hypothetical protein HZB51_15115 [Chloroflexi bacterium]|nr:hypothetical protein [Chloroflexota bacterium]
MKFSVGPLLVVLLAVFAVAPLEYPGAFQSHTGLAAVYNLIHLDQFPAQFWNWAPTVGRHFDLFRTDGALPYLVAEIFHWIGFSFLDSIKLVYALAWMASGLAMYALARRWFSENGALLAAIVYVYLPFHIATVYVRGAFAEAVAWSIFPIVLLVASRLGRSSSASPVASRLRFTLYVLPFVLLFLTQPGIAILFSLFTIIIAAALGNWRSGLRSSVGGLIVGALLYLPTIFRYGAIILPNGFNANFVLPFQLFSSLWGYDVSTGSYLDKFPLQLGVVPIGLAIVAVALAWRGNAVDWKSTADRAESRLEADSCKRRIEMQRLVVVLLASAVVTTLLTFEIFAPVWKLLGVFVAYPWQLLALVGFALALVAGAAVEFDARLSRPAMLAFFVGLPVIASYNFLAPRFFETNPTRPAIAFFGNNEIALWSYRIVGPLRHGATDRLQLTWQALRPVDHDYTVFVHAVHENGNTYAKEDSKPQDGAMPTLKWTPGQVISDTHTIQIDIDGPSEGYHLEVGLYNAATGQRALMENGADVLILPRPGDPEPTITDQVRPSQK